MIVKVSNTEGTTFRVVDALTRWPDGRCQVSKFTGVPDPSVITYNLTGSVTLMASNGVPIAAWTTEEKADG